MVRTNNSVLYRLRDIQKAVVGGLRVRQVEALLPRFRPNDRSSFYSNDQIVGDLVMNPLYWP